MFDTIISIILFILAFAILICIHEAGHLSMAKLFKVYCKEYSIGFGPKIFSRKKEGHETRFSIRAIPLGGYVAMYGEGGEEDPELKDVPFERSLEGIKKWKKAIVLSAGVILNAILAFVLIFISNAAFPTIYYTRNAHVTPNSLIANEGIVDDDQLQFYYPESYSKDGSLQPFYYEYSDSDKVLHANNFFIVDPDVTLEDGTHYVLTYMFDGNKKEPVFSDGLLLYKGLQKDELNDSLKYDKDLKEVFINWAKEEGSPEYYPNFEGGTYSSTKDYKFTAHLRFIKDDAEKTANVEIKVTYSTKGKKVINTFEDIGLRFKTDKRYQKAGAVFKNTFADFGTASSAVFKGMKILFTGGIRNMSGIVGIFDTSASLYTKYTFQTYLFFWGLISINLAIFNLLPFPGLDGWQLLVTAIEGISRKKLPPKFKTIMSLIGLGLLFVLMIFIVVFDILRIIGV